LGAAGCFSGHAAVAAAALRCPALRRYRSAQCFRLRGTVMLRIAIVTAAAFLPALALAQPGGGRGGGAPAPAPELAPTADIMAANDRNRDGKITSAEAREAGTFLAANFFTFD